MSSLFNKLNERFKLIKFMNTMLPTMGALGLQFVTFAITARGLGVEQFGRYSALLAVVGIGVELVGLGGADLLVRAVSRNRTTFKSYYGNMLMLIAFTLPIVVLGSVIVAIHGMHTSISIWFATLALFAEIFIARLSASMELVMVAHGHTVRAGWVRMTTVVMRLVTAFLFFSLFKRTQLDSWINMIVLQSSLLAALYVWLGGRLYGQPVLALLKGELSSGCSFCITQSARSAQSNLDRMVLSRYADDTVLGLYGAASRFLQLGLFPLQVVTRIIYPHYFIHGEKGLAESRRYAIRMVPLLLGVGIISGLAVAAAALVVPKVLGAQYGGSVKVSIGLACSLPFMAMQYPAADALTGAGKQALRATIYSFSALAFGGFLVAGVQLFGVNGLIGAFAVGHGVLAFVLWLAAFFSSDPILQNKNNSSHDH